ncbi:MAG TPA: hypothetical protein V6C64_05560 [Microcoleaceae cyanobacterium]
MAGKGMMSDRGAAIKTIGQQGMLKPDGETPAVFPPIDDKQTIVVAGCVKLIT